MKNICLPGPSPNHLPRQEVTSRSFLVAVYCAETTPRQNGGGKETPSRYG